MSSISDTLSECLTTLEKSAHSVTQLSHAGCSFISCESSGSRIATLRSRDTQIREQEARAVQGACRERVQRSPVQGEVHDLCARHLQDGARVRDATFLVGAV